MARAKVADAGAGAEVRRLRESRGLTQTELSQSVSLSPSYLAAIERGERTGWSPPLLFSLSKALGVECSHWEPFFSEGAESAPRQARPRGRPRKDAAGGESPASVEGVEPPATDAADEVPKPGRTRKGTEGRT